MIDKSKWLEDEEEWLIPTLRIKSVDYNGKLLPFLFFEFPYSFHIALLLPSVFIFCNLFYSLTSVFIRFNLFSMTMSIVAV